MSKRLMPKRLVFILLIPVILPILILFISLEYVFENKTFKEVLELYWKPLIESWKYPYGR